jgi:hypothetical protein
MPLNFLWLLLIICNIFKPFMTKSFHPLWLLPTIHNNITCYLDLKSHVHLFVVAFQWYLLSCGRRYFLFQILPQKVKMYKIRNIYIYEHNKTLCNTNMNYYLLFFHTLSNQTPTNSYENLLNIFHCIKTNTTFSHVFLLFFHTKVSHASIFLMI